MPGYVGGSLNAAGTKIINSNIANPTRGLPRASGLTLLFDTTSAYILCMMEGAFISSLRTASVSMLAAEVLRGRKIQDVAVIGAGVLAHAHIRLLIKRRAHFPDLRCIHLFDLEAGRVSALQDSASAIAAAIGIEVHIAASAEEAIRAAQLIIPVTTTTTGYIRFDWLQPGACLVNISLDDPLPEVVLKADRVIVDDWNLVKNDSRRLLGRMYRSGQVSGPHTAGDEASSDCRRVDAELGEVVAGLKPGRRHEDEVILVNPFGMAIEDVALATRVYQLAMSRQLGIQLER